MPRRGIDLTEEQWRKAKAQAALLGITVSQYIGGLLGDDTAYDDPKAAKSERRVDTAKRLEIDDATDHLVSRLTERAAAVADMRPFGSSQPAPKPGKKR